MVFCSCTGKVNSFGWLRYSGFVCHKEPSLDAVGALADPCAAHVVSIQMTWNTCQVPMNNLMPILT